MEPAASRAHYHVTKYGASSITCSLSCDKTWSQQHHVLILKSQNMDYLMDMNSDIVVYIQNVAPFFQGHVKNTIKLNLDYFTHTVYKLRCSNSFYIPVLRVDYLSMIGNFTSGFPFVASGSGSNTDPHLLVKRMRIRNTF
jgi:hypothetical protein